MSLSDLKIIYVLAAIVAVGSNMTSVYWQRAADRHASEELIAELRGRHAELRTEARYA